MIAKAKSILVMGVSGSGKSHVGRQVAAAMDATFLDGDDYHSPGSIAKMSRGQPLNDGDREAWLATLADLYREYQAQGISLVIGCSALKHRYRDQLRAATPHLDILYLHGDRSVLMDRLERRSEHFFAGATCWTATCHPGSSLSGRSLPRGYPGHAPRDRQRFSRPPRHGVEPAMKIVSLSIEKAA